MKYLEKRRILIVDDDVDLSFIISDMLESYGYVVTCVETSEEAFAALEEKSFHLILLDIMLPGLNGLEVLRRLNKENPTPVILLTARDAVMDKVSGLDAGAVDYVTKPFAIEELLARIRVALKLHKGTRGGRMEQEQSVTGAESGIYRWGELVLQTAEHTVRYAGQAISLTNREFCLLETLLENMDIVLSRDILLEKVCGYEYAGETNVIDVYVRYLRSKIDEAFGVRMIQTVRGVGYVIRS